MAKYFRMGGVVTDTPSDIILLRCTVTTSGRVSTPRLNTGTAGYAVTAGKKFYITSIHVSSNIAVNTTIHVGIGYSDTDLGIDVVTARTNPINVLGEPEQVTGDLMGGWRSGNLNTEVNNGLKMKEWQDVVIPGAPAGKYFYVKGIVGTPVDVQIWGVEVTV